MFRRWAWTTSNAANVTDVIGEWNGGGIDVIYDSDGSILTNFFGLPPQYVLGITNIDFVEAGQPRRSSRPGWS